MSKINDASYERTRRDFLRSSARTGFLFAIGYPLISISNRVWGSARVSSTVDLAVVTGDPEKSVRKAIDLLGGIIPWLAGCSAHLECEWSRG